MDKSIPICQSCGMPIEKSTDFGTSIINTLNEDYWIYCYKEGDFTAQRMSLERMIEKLIPRAVDMGLTVVQARKMAHDKLSRLKRWRKD
jgi:hypothetical protein